MAITDITLQLEHNKVVVIAADTILGLSTLINPTALDALYRVKQRERTHGIIIVSKYIEHFLPFIDLAAISEEKFAILTATYAHPTTFLVPAKPQLGWLIGEQHTKIAVRLVHTGLLSILTETLNQALTSTSANISGQPPATSMQQLRYYFAQNVIYTDLEDYFNACADQPKLPSNIIDLLTNEVIRHA